MTTPQKSTITSLELVDQINIFRKEDGKSELLHKNLLSVIRDEFEEEINEGIVSRVTYKDKKGEDRPMFELTHTQCERVLFRIKNKSRIKMGLQEEASLKTIEQLLKIQLLRQFKVGKYRVDGYDPENNTVYEIDEPHHRFIKEKDKKRELFIINHLKCKVIRIKL